MVIVPLFMLGRVHEAFPILWPLRLVLITSLVLLMVTLFNGGLKANRLKLLWYSTTFRWFSALLCLMLFSVVFSIWPSKSLYYFADFFQYFTILLLALNCQINQREDFRFCITGIVLTIFIMGGICFITPQYTDGRVHGNLSFDPNDTALFIIMTIMLVLPSMSYIKTLYKMLLCMLTLMGVGVLVLTESRGGLIALVVTIAAWGLSGGFKGILKVAVFAFFGLTLLLILFPTERFERFSTIFDLKEDYNVTAKHGRIDVWKNGFKIFQDNWIVGTGVATFATAEGQVNEGGKWSSAHNSFLQIAVELGLPGFLVFVGMLFSAYRWAKPRDEADWFSKGIRLALICFCVGGMFLSWGYHWVLYFILSIAMIRERVLALEDLTLQGQTPS